MTTSEHEADHADRLVERAAGDQDDAGDDLPDHHAVPDQLDGEPRGEEAPGEQRARGPSAGARALSGVDDAQRSRRSAGPAHGASVTAPPASVKPATPRSVLF